MNILVVNDDGYKAEGLAILVRALQPFGNIYVSAPKTHQSGKSHAISFHSRIETFFTDPIIGSKETLVVDGTPADATRLGLKLFNVDFDLVVSGINNGVNVATDVLYSGTVAAALEAKLLGVNAIAISAPNMDVTYLYDETIKLIDELIEAKAYDGDGILNINFPKASFKKPLGVRITQQGLRLQVAEYIKSEKPDVYHIKGSIINYQENENADIVAYEEGYISITPLQFDRTNYSRMDKLLNP
jgi:5'-nucleotidase